MEIIFFSFLISGLMTLILRQMIQARFKSRLDKNRRESDKIQKELESLKIQK